MSLSSFLRALALLTIMSHGSIAWAENSIYVVDIQRVINESELGKAARAKIEADAKVREGRVEKLKKEVEQQRGELEKQAKLLSADALELRREALSKKEREFARSVQDEREELQKRQGIVLERVVKNIDEVTAELAQKGGYDVVLEKDRQVVLYVDPSFDLTGRVIDGLNKRKVTIPE